MSSEFIQILREAIKTPELLKEIYGDIAKPGVKQVGEALGTVLGLGNTILLPLMLVNEKAKIVAQRNLEKFRVQMADVPSEQVIEVPPEIGVPVIEKLTYVTDDEISDLYVNLLAKASTEPTANQAHPGFVNIIGGLSPDEANILKQFREQQAHAFVTARWYRTGTSEWRQVGDLLSQLSIIGGLRFPDNVPAYISNLSGLGILEVSRNTHVVPQDVYGILDHRFRSKFTEQVPPEQRSGFELRFDRGRIDRTLMGQMFVQACMKKLR